MADAKPKPDVKKADKPAPKKTDPFVEIVSLIAMFFFAVYVLNGIISYFGANSLLTRGIGGFSAEGIMRAHTRPINSLANPIGAKIATIHKHASVFASPGGKQIGEQEINARGTIIQGPIEVNGERYWYVDFVKDPDGWVRESDIGFLQSEPNLFERFLLWLYSLTFVGIFLSVLISIALLIWIVYVVVRLTHLRKEQHAKIYPAPAPEPLEGTTVPAKPVNPKWLRILNHIESLNENDWRLAIIEADILLDEVLEKLGLPGDSIGEKLKAADRNTFVTLNNAWEAHKVRNEIAHNSNFVLTQREARRVVDLYKTVFDEFSVS